MYKPLTTAANITTGKLDSNAAKENGAYLFFTCAPEPLSIDKFSFDDDAILLAGNNAQGDFHINRYCGKFDAYQRTYVITAKEGFDIDYVYYSLELALRQLKRISQGSQTKFLTMQILDGFMIEDIPFDSQTNLIASIKAIDEKIALNKSINAELEALAKTLYDYWFVQFDFPDENGKPYKSSGGKMVWNGELKREIPEEWSASKIKSFCTVTSGYPFESESYLTSGHYKLITIKNIQDDGINLVVNNFIETLPSNLPEYCKLKDGDILMSLTGNVGRVGLMYDNSCLLNQRVAIINPSKEAIRSYVYFLFKSDSLRMTMERIATGSAQKNLSPVSTELLNIPYDNVVAEKYSMIIDSAMKEMVLRLKENYELIRLRDFLLPLLMNGQVVINE
jgi:type I restriction enzyme S subunit